eukprot:GHVT01019561.1.p1 GENE.GHVT01019561.1~~GHVT01019561.1.p1  ORF type:complete len:299 (+),score=79.05 GHVT01019561.1:139-1035(+)
MVPPSVATPVPARPSLRPSASGLSPRIANLESSLSRCSSYGSGLLELQLLLESLRDFSSLAVMVPLGKLAFMEGRLVHTNEVYSSLGLDYFALRSSYRAVEALKQRAQQLKAQWASMNKQLETLRLLDKAMCDRGAAGSCPANIDQAVEKALADVASRQLEEEQPREEPQHHEQPWVEDVLRRTREATGVTRPCLVKPSQILLRGTWLAAPTPSPDPTLEPRQTGEHQPTAARPPPPAAAQPAADDARETHWTPDGLLDIREAVNDAEQTPGEHQDANTQAAHNQPGKRFLADVVERF